MGLVRQGGNGQRMVDRSAVEDYGLLDTERTASHAHLEPELLAWLRRAGARRILDSGCCNGALCSALKDSGYEVTGCGADINGIRPAPSRSPDVRFEAISLDVSPYALWGKRLMPWSRRKW